MKPLSLLGSRPLRVAASVSLLASALTGCASTNPKDPFEGFNRAMFGFNEGMDKALIKPTAQAYENVLPAPAQQAVGNFFGNLQDPWIAVNNFLQGRPADAVGDVARFVFNSTLGVLGLIDLATPAGLEKHDEDFGQTLGVWGSGPGPYVVLPVLGPKTARDTLGTVVDQVGDPVSRMDHVPTRNVTLGVRLVDRRAQLLPADKIIEEAALDKYSYVRDAYLQNRRSAVLNGNVPKGEE